MLLPTARCRTCDGLQWWPDDDGLPYCGLCGDGWGDVRRPAAVPVEPSGYNVRICVRCGKRLPYGAYAREGGNAHGRFVCRVNCPALAVATAS